MADVMISERQDKAFRDLIAVCERMRPDRILLAGVPDNEAVNLVARAGTLREFVAALDAI